MKTQSIKLSRLIPLLGIALVASGLVAAAAYLDLEREIKADEAFTATHARLAQDYQLSAVLKLIQDGETEAAAWRVDLVLCDDLLLLNSQLGATDDRTRAFAKDAFARIALIRPMNPPTAAGTAQKFHGVYQIGADNILIEASAGSAGAKEGVAALR